MWTRTEYPFPIPVSVREIILKLWNEGFETYVVGGFVRDRLRGDSSEKQDIDLATAASPDDICGLFPNVLRVGEAFGSVRIPIENHAFIEVTQFRKEGQYSDDRHPESIEAATLVEDVQRRDFTINALYWDLKTRRIFDAVGGIQDLKDLKLKAVGQASHRLKEDALRILRALRFKNQFQMTFDSDLSDSLMPLGSKVKKLSIERIRAELEKMIFFPQFKDVLMDLDRYSIFKEVFPEISVVRLEHPKVWEQTLRSAWMSRNLPVSRDFTFRLALMHSPALRLTAMDQREDFANRIARRLKLSDQDRKRFVFFLQESSKFRDAFSMRPATLYRWMKEDYFEELLDFHEVDALSWDGNLAGLEFVKREFQISRDKIQMKPLVTGDDLLRLGYPPGPQFSYMLRYLEDLQLEGKINSTDEALTALMERFSG